MRWASGPRNYPWPCHTIVMTIADVFPGKQRMCHAPPSYPPFLANAFSRAYIRPVVLSIVQYEHLSPSPDGPGVYEKPIQAICSSEPTISIRDRTLGGLRRASGTFGCFPSGTGGLRKPSSRSRPCDTMGSLNVALCGLFLAVDTDAGAHRTTCSVVPLPPCPRPCL